MGDVKSPVSSFGLGSEFDAFLFASIGEDRNGLSVSVVSLLGRMDLDPWHEAARLAGLPAEAAAESLTTLLGRLPGPPLQQPHPGDIATRLVGLLPRRPKPGPRPLRTSIFAGMTKRGRWNVIFLAVCLSVVLATQVFMARIDPTRVPAAAAPAPNATTSQPTPDIVE